MGVVEGAWGIVMPTEGGKYKYILYPYEAPQAGDRALIYPAHSGKYYLIKLATDVVPGQKIIMISDRKGNHWGVLGE